MVGKNTSTESEVEVIDIASDGHLRGLPHAPEVEVINIESDEQIRGHPHTKSVDLPERNVGAHFHVNGPCLCGTNRFWVCTCQYA